MASSRHEYLRSNPCQDVFKLPTVNEALYRIAPYAPSVVHAFYGICGLFAAARNRVRTPTLFTFRNLNEEVFSGLMDDGWETRTTDFEDLIRCTVACPSVVFRSHIGRQTLYVNFYYTRERLVDRVWVPMEQEHGVQLVDLKCEVLGQIPPLMLTFSVGSCWPIEHLRGEVQISMGQATPTDFHFVVADSVNAPRKIN